MNDTTDIRGFPNSWAPGYPGQCRTDAHDQIWGWVDGSWVRVPALNPTTLLEALIILVPFALLLWIVMTIVLPLILL